MTLPQHLDVIVRLRRQKGGQQQILKIAANGLAREDPIMIDAANREIKQLTPLPAGRSIEVEGGLKSQRRPGFTSEPLRQTGFHRVTRNL